MSSPTLSLEPGLYIVATPLGNLSDITIRALETLASVDVIYCEDTRVSHTLLRHYAITTEIKTYNEHSDDHLCQRIIQSIVNDKKRIALISDAGTPLISDPGSRLVSAAYEHQLMVSTLPGPSSVIAALTLSGLPATPFTFLGFLPHKSAGRQTLLAETPSSLTLVCFDAPTRVKDTLIDIDHLFPNRRIALIREISKRFEETIRGTAKEVKAILDSRKDSLRGECVLVLGPLESPKELSKETSEALKLLVSSAIAHHPLKKVVQAIAEISGLHRNALYDLALTLKQQGRTSHESSEEG